MRFSLFSPACVLVAAAAQAALASTIVESRANSNNNGATDVQVRDGNRTISMPVPLQAVQGVDSGVAISPDAELRILCIGDSITVGAGSSHKDGYREQLREHLSGELLMAGSRCLRLRLKLTFAQEMKSSLLATSAEGTWTTATM